MLTADARPRAPRRGRPAAALAAASALLLAGCAAVQETDAAESPEPTPTQTVEAIDWPALSAAMPADDDFAAWSWATTPTETGWQPPAACEVDGVAEPRTPTMLIERSWAREVASGPQQLYVAARHYDGVDGAQLLEEEATFVACPPFELPLEGGTAIVSLERSETAFDAGDAVLAYRQVYRGEVTLLQEAIVVACGDVVLTTSHWVLEDEVDRAAIAEWAGVAVAAADGMGGRC